MIAAMRRFGIVLALTLWGLSGCGTSRPHGSATPTSPSARELLRYGAGHTFYELSQPPGPARGTMIVIHGGGWADAGPVDGESVDAGPVAGFLAEGWRVLAIGYEEPRALVDASAPPDPRPTLDDVIAFYDQARRAFTGPICADGWSAGGHLAMMLAVERPQLTCVIAAAAPLDLQAFARRDPALVHRVFGSDAAVLDWWSPMKRWRAAAPKTHVWITNADNDPLVPARSVRFAAVDPQARVVNLPGDKSGVRFIHSSVVPSALSKQYTDLARWLASIGGRSLATVPTAPQHSGFIPACNDAVPNGIDWSGKAATGRWLLLDDGSGWSSATSAPSLTVTRGCDGTGRDQWAGWELKALDPSALIPYGAAAALALTAPNGRTFASLNASFRGWFKRLADWQVGLYASRSAAGSDLRQVAACDAGTCRGLTSSPTVATGSALAPDGTVGDPEQVGRLPHQRFALPAATRLLMWRLACVARAGCQGRSVNPGGDPVSRAPLRTRDPIGHPAVFTVTGMTASLAGRQAEPRRG